MKKKIALNMGSSLLMEVVSVICAFILPRLIMVSFGSEYNGIVSSVSQFLSFITLLRGGIGGVTRAALYKPLVDHDYVRISGIINATERFMRRVCYIFIASLFVFATVYPFIIHEAFGWFYTCSLVIILGLSTIAQYFFGITYQFLLQSDQKQYVYNVLQICATIINTVLSVVLIRMNMEFRLVKLTSAIVFGAIPIIMYFYVRKEYPLIKDVPPDHSAIEQRWDAFAHQVAGFVHSNTDLIILTILTDLFQVAIYSIYFMVANGVKRFVVICSSGIETALGNLIARDKKETLLIGIDLYEWLINVVSVVFFTCSAILIVPFVMIYTQGVCDADYYQPLLGYLMCIAQFVACVRLPYINTIEAAGHFKQTRNGAIAEAVINIIITIPLVVYTGCVGAVIGTIVATLFRTIQYAIYASQKIINRSVLLFIKRMLVSVLNVAIIMIPFLWGRINEELIKLTSYIEWFRVSFVVFLLVSAITFIFNFIFYYRTSKSFFAYVLRGLIHKHKCSTPDN